MSKSINIITSNRGLYKKLNTLYFKSEILLTKDESKFINRIIKNFNFKRNNIRIEQVGNSTKLIKVNPVNFNVFYRSK